MQRTLVNLVVDLATAAAMAGMLLTGYLIRFPLPPGSNKAWMLWGLTRHQWGDVHFWIGAALLALVLVHVCLHWNWVVTVIRPRLGLGKPRHHGLVPDALVVVLFLAGGFAAFARIAHDSVQRVPGPHTDSCAEPASASPAASAPVPIAEPPPPPPPPPPIWDDVAPMLRSACVSCHGPIRQKGGFRIDRAEFLLQGSTPWVVPGKSDESPLIAIVSGQREIALPSRHRLPDADVTRLRQWIDGGAMSPDPGTATAGKG